VESFTGLSFERTYNFSADSIGRVV